MPDSSSIPSLHDLLRRRMPRVVVTPVLIGANLLVFLAMLASGAGWGHSSNEVQLAWGANFGPATQDGQWWRLASAMFLHFGALHLLVNMWALWDSGQLVERMVGRWRFAAIYFLSGIVGNLLSLVAHQGQVISGGASGAIFGVYGALLLCLWRERRTMQAHEFRWLFWGAAAFAALTIGFGLLIPGIDNAAHAGGFCAGLLGGAGLMRPVVGSKALARRSRWLVGAAGVLMLLLLVSRIPAPAYRWSDEALARKELGVFLRGDAEISRTWQGILNESSRGGVSFEELAGRIDADVGDRYAESFEQLSQLPLDPALPSASSVVLARQYAALRRDASRSLAEGLRHRDARKIREAMRLDRQSRELQRPKR